ncbi:MAG: hypothetical protein IJ711_11715 [Lachnospiraceae bacterium]|nr:hypothetical protein [Lachnospiraceae bacterium]
MKIGKKIAKAGKTAKLPRASLLSRFDWLNRFHHWFLGGTSVTRSLFRVAAAWQTVGILVGVITVGYIMAAFYTQSGEFVVSLNRKLADDGFLISETPDFSERLITLHGTAVVGANNISIYDIAPNVMDVDGDHNGLNYVAYTWYVKNAGSEAKDYHFNMQLKNFTQGMEKASWIMFFREGEQTIYAMARDDGTPERQFSDGQFPFMEYASEEMKEKVTQLTNADRGYLTPEKMDELGLQSAEGIYQLETVPFESMDSICTGIRPQLEPGGVDKYTAVIWVEGEDPECVDDIIGGTIELAVRYTY